MFEKLCDALDRLEMANRKVFKIEARVEVLEAMVAAAKTLNDAEGFTVTGISQLKLDAKFLILSETKDLILGQVEQAKKNIKRCAKAMAEKKCGEILEDKAIAEKAQEIFDGKMEPVSARIEEVNSLCEMAEKQILEFFK